ncbi:xylan 1,4-beta-xylosidase [Planomonospora sp. ID67723]|uniref:GH39 family glycosyl hydrolase n=1 Tax=Planomonospora sp. ID67723 TaxID=2738134 RepID=UPI0018C394CA|nr:glycosyl hydrolase [Planomonospora sp. ID67723]MBG0829726.1 xylan 1,4-beta-xylosidase [Planomonospora sp. ID67723]
MSSATSDARSDWEERIGRRSGEAPAGAPRLPAPAGLAARPGQGQVTLTWEPVEGAAGYLVHRAPGPGTPYEPVDHLGRDVLAVPHPPYADTTGVPGQEAWYAVAAVAGVEAVGELSAPVPATPHAGTHGEVRIAVRTRDVVRELPRPWRPMIGSEHLSHMLCPDLSGGRPIGRELTEALRIARDELGVETVRAHGILCDDLGVYREGRPYDFSGVDRVYDRLLEIGLRPVVELSFMPRDLACDPAKTVFAYDAIVSPPKDWERWGDLIRSFTAHLVDRYGAAEVRDRWSFEVWNEANLEVFWSGTPAEYIRLYDVSARAVKEVDPALRVGGPSSAAAGWVDELLASAREPVDFVSTHTYGSPPLDLRPVLDRYGKAGTPIWWTEWGVTPVHFNEVSDAAFAAVFLARGMKSAAGRIDALSYWVASDHFEELGRPSELLHGGFGLLTVGNLRKPRFHVLALLERLGRHEVAVDCDGDGAGAMVEAWAAGDDDGRVTLAVWNGTLDQSKAAGDPLLDRHVTVRLTGLDAGRYELRHLRVDQEHSNIASVWGRIRDGGAWPTPDQWETLREADQLDHLHAPYTVEPVAGEVETAFHLPMPGMSFLELLPRG